MDLLRDSMWQFVGVVVAVITAVASGIVWLLSRRRSRGRSRNEEVIAELKRHLLDGASPGFARHKKRKNDGILLANISSDFLNQFPVPVAVMAAHLDRLYTPENFGEPDWLGVFRRLTMERYFTPVRERSPKRITVESLLNPGPLLESWLRPSAAAKRRIAGLDDED